MIEADRKPVLGPNSRTLQLLTEATFTEPKNLTKPNGVEIRTRLVITGAGMMGLKDKIENREWAGISANHTLKVAGGFLVVGRLLQLNGQQIDLQLGIDTIMLSHRGRRQLDEAGWYPNEVEKAEEKKQMGDTVIGILGLQDKNLPPELLEMISVHGLGLTYSYDATDTWNKKLPLYLDYRISQDAMSLEERFRDLQRGVETGRWDQKWVDDTKVWAEGVEQELFEALRIPSYEVITDNPGNLRARINTAIKLGKFSEDEAKTLRATDFYLPKSGRKGDIAEAVSLSHEEFLTRLQLYPEDINDQLLQPERWERYIRRLYIHDAEEQIFGRLSELNGNPEQLDKEFPRNIWWGQYVRELYSAQDGKPLLSKPFKQSGIARAIEFYRRIEENRSNP